VRNWGTEYSIGYTGDFNNNFDFYVRLYGSKNLDILGMQEFSPMLDATYQHPASQLLSKFFNKMYLAKDGILVPTATNIQIYNFEYNKFTTNRWYTTGTITLANNQTVKVVNVHASPGSGSASARATEYAYLVSMLQAEDYFIITGDFNAMDVSEYSPFINAGFNLANGGNFGTFNTCWYIGDTWLPCDNIITSSKLNIVAVEMAEDRGTSDHKLLVADIVCNKW
jgi:endonuclease/exonuclease/phosphatase family metal-dependent hydrolase